MRIVLPGGSGQIGTLLARHFSAAGHEVTVLSRFERHAPWPVVPWDAETLGSWVSELDGADVVVNLAGRNVNCRYTAKNRRAIFESRVNSTRVVGEAIAKVARPPHTWLQASTATIYAHRYDRANDEASGLLGGSEPDVPPAWRFSIEVATAWERAQNEANTPRTRKVKLRAAPVMSPDRGGIFDTLLGLVGRGLGGTQGDGRQYVSWIHARDFIRAIDMLIARTDLADAVNLAAPEPLPNSAFMRLLRESAGIKFGLPAPGPILELGAFLLRTETELALKSRRVTPRRLLENGFIFEFPTWRAASSDLAAAWRVLVSRGTGRC